ncbi:hypothetical protein [Pseudoalteromonas sp. SG44-8]|uniref:hypothetical protein n=1 Tax=Pseudoalteromonas sp. SG44-8 TaxID=2760958 RepID=UPI001C7229C2|nr:hypothetical protein [Pseudoalteromonas sp. SG44-8]
MYSLQFSFSSLSSFQIAFMCGGICAFSVSDKTAVKLKIMKWTEIEMASPVNGSLGIGSFYIGVIYKPVIWLKSVRWNTIFDNTAINSWWNIGTIRCFKLSYIELTVKHHGGCYV